ncbi:hypothetical protein KLEP174_gp54 [Pseudomonas phage vB_PcuM_ KLEP17-4]|nr:hypothetical protein KLEP174_gp54 [Pseudomonas phage vB_PcuM_ KLEP17-4]
MMACNEPQAHPARCGCEQKAVPTVKPWAGFNVIRNDDLPAQTMIVSRDIFDMLKEQGVKP